MPHSLHRMTFTQKVLQTDVSILNFKFFDDDCDLSPFGPVNKTKSTLIDLGFELKLVPLDFNV